MTEDPSSWLVSFGSVECRVLVWTYGACKHAEVPQEVDPVGWAFLGNGVEGVPHSHPHRIHEDRDFWIITQAPISHPDLGQKGVGVRRDTCAGVTTHFRVPPSTSEAGWVLAGCYA
jgi:hypothetical protein